MSTYLGSAPRDVEVLLICKRKGHTPARAPCKSCRDCLTTSPRFFPGKVGQHLILIGCFIIRKSSLQSCHLVDWKSDEFTPFILLSSREKSAYSGPPDPAKNTRPQGRQLYLISVNLSKSPGHSDIQAPHSVNGNYNTYSKEFV